MKLFALIFCILVTVLSLVRALKLKSWLKLTGKVLGPSDGSVDTSFVRIEFLDPSGLKREFTSGIGFGHSFWAPYSKRIPYQKNDEVSILVNPKNYQDAELNVRMVFILPILLLLSSIYLACRLFYFS
jgi:hypothetical protein